MSPGIPHSREEADELVGTVKRELGEYNITTGPMPNSYDRAYVHLWRNLWLAREFYESIEDKASVVDKLAEVDKLETEAHYYYGKGDLQYPKDIIGDIKDGRVEAHRVHEIRDKHLPHIKNSLESAEYHFLNALEIYFQREIFSIEDMIKNLVGFHIAKLYEKRIERIEQWIEIERWIKQPEQSTQ